jgi:L-asparaginase
MIADCINKYYKSQDGIVRIHGTATLAYTSSMLSYMLKGLPIPVVITGSQLSIINPVADALENMRIAIYMAKNNYPGVFVAFNRKIMLAKCVSKTHSKSFNAFESINCGNVAEVNSYGIQVDEKLIPKVDPFFRVKSNFSDKVFLLKITPGLNPDIIDYLIEKEYKGIIIESYGLGGLPTEKDNDFISKCKEAIEKGIKIIVLSQCTYDGVDLNVYETGMKTKEMGIISMPLATKEYAYTRLMWELGNN